MTAQSSPKSDRSISAMPDNNVDVRERVDTGINTGEDAALLAELLKISNMHASSRFQKTNSSYVSTTATDGESDHTGNNEIHDAAQSFLENTPQNSRLNQYWYSRATIKVLCEAITEVASGKRVAFLSTPSLYFALPIEERKNCTLFERDEIWANDPGFEMYNFNKAEDVNPTLRHSFDMVVVDPPFITHDVWEKYATTTKILLKAYDTEESKDPGHVIATTVAENIDIMDELFHAKPTVFRPTIPNLVYQYNVYTNFDCEALSTVNPEVKL